MLNQPYGGFSWQDLGVIASELRDQLLARAPLRERVGLDDRIVALLAEFTNRIDPGAVGNPLSRVRRMGPDMLTRAVSEAARDECANVRLRHLNAASDYVFGSEGRWWLQRALLPGAMSPYLAAHAGHEGLIAALELLEAELVKLHAQRREEET